MKTLEAIITQAWGEKDSLTFDQQGPFADAITEVIKQIGTGNVRVSAKSGTHWLVNVWLKQAVLLYFRMHNNVVIPGQFTAFDKVPLKCSNWDQDNFDEAGFRLVPGAVVREGAFVGKNVVVMPSFINIGAYVDEGTMVDSYATIGSCAQIGKNCHISSGAVIAGVLEPMQANPVIIEDNCFIGAQTSIVEGAIVEQGAVIGMGVQIGSSTPIVDRATGEVSYGRVPPLSVVVPGTMPAKDGQNDIRTNCAVIVKTVTESTRKKTAINELLRE